jgi:tetratricopeptide (TPR) repeat protein
VRPLYDAGRYAEAADKGRELIEDHPDDGQLYYNTACCESLAGEPAHAVEHLGRAIEMREGGVARWRAATPTSTRFATSPLSRISSAVSGKTAEATDIRLALGRRRCRDLRRRLPGRQLAAP